MFYLVLQKAQVGCWLGHALRELVSLCHRFAPLLFPLPLEMCGKSDAKIVVALSSIHIMQKSSSVHPETSVGVGSREIWVCAFLREITGSADAAHSRVAPRDLEGYGYLRVTQNAHAVHTLPLGIQRWDLFAPYPLKGMVPFLVC